MKLWVLSILATLVAQLGFTGEPNPNDPIRTSLQKKFETAQVPNPADLHLGNYWDCHSVALDNNKLISLYGYFFFEQQPAFISNLRGKASEKVFVLNDFGLSGSRANGNHHVLQTIRLLAEGEIIVETATNQNPDGALPSIIDPQYKILSYITCRVRK